MSQLAPSHDSCRANNQTPACAENSILRQYRRPTANSHRNPIDRLVRRFLFRLAPQPVSPVFPATRPSACAAGFRPPSVPADRFWFAPESVLLGSAFDSSPGLRHDPSLQPLPSMLLSARAAAASSGLPAISPGLRQRSILQPTVSFNSRLAPQTDCSGAPLMLALACASVCIFWLLQIAASDSHRLPPSGCPAIPLSDLRRSLYPPVMPFN